QHVNRGTDNAPKRKHRRDLKKMKLLHLPAVSNRAEEDHDFGGKVCETGKANGGESSETENQTGERHHFRETAKVIERKRSGTIANLAGDAEQQRNRETMSEDQCSRASRSKNVRARDAEKNVAHVHHAGIAKHPIELLLRDRDEPDVDDVPEQKNREQIHKIMRALRQKRRGQPQ